MSIDKFRNRYRFEDFKPLAEDPALSKYEKIGFPDSYRAGKEGAIFEDIISKIKIKKKTQVCYPKINAGRRGGGGG